MSEKLCPEETQAFEEETVRHRRPAGQCLRREEAKRVRGASIANGLLHSVIVHERAILDPDGFSIHACTITR